MRGNYGEYGVGGEAPASRSLAERHSTRQRLVWLFDRNYNGRIGRSAGEANRWFRRFCHRDHDLRVTDNEINPVWSCST